MEINIGELIIQSEILINEIIVDNEINIDDIKLDIIKQEVVTTNYEKLNNLPQINSMELIGNKTAKDLKLQGEMRALTNLELEQIFKVEESF